MWLFAGVPRAARAEQRTRRWPQSSARMSASRGTGDEKLCRDDRGARSRGIETPPEVAAIMRSAASHPLYDCTRWSGRPSLQAMLGAAPVPPTVAPEIRPLPPPLHSNACSATIAPVARLSGAAAPLPACPVAVAPLSRLLRCSRSRCPACSIAVVSVAAPAPPGSRSQVACRPRRRQPGSRQRRHDKQDSSEASSNWPAGKGAPLHRSGSRIRQQVLPVASEATVGGWRQQPVPARAPCSRRREASTRPRERRKPGRLSSR